MNEVIRWTLGVMFTLILGSYGYTWSVGVAASSANDSVESRISRQLDIIEHKVDQVIERQYNDARLYRRPQ